VSVCVCVCGYKLRVCILVCVCVCVCVRALLIYVVVDPCVLAGEGKSGKTAARRIANLEPNAREAAMQVFTHVPTRTALNHDTRTKEKRGKDDERTDKERIDLFVRANPGKPRKIAPAKEWIRSLKPTKIEGKVKGLALARLRWRIIKGVPAD
jgi:hypothetical protein